MKLNLQGEMKDRKREDQGLRRKNDGPGASFLKRRAAFIGKIAVVSTLSLTSLVQCGKKAGEDEISKNFAVVLVSQPLVHFTTQTRNGRTYTPPWYEVQLKVQNTFKRPIKIDEIVFYTTVNGVELTGQSLDFGDLTQTINDNVYTYETYCVYPNDGKAYFLAACAPNRTSPDPTVNNEERSIISPVKIPVLDLGDVNQIVNYVFPVRVQIRGYSLDGQGMEVDRFSKTITFTTR